MDIPDDHPRAKSLRLRHLVTEGLEAGIVAKAGLIAHGRGEAYDYLLGEQTRKPAIEAIKAAVAVLLLADSPVISVNGNTCALCSDDIVKLSDATSCAIEVNLFYRSRERLEKIRDVLMLSGAKSVYGIQTDIPNIPSLSSERAKSELIADADVVLVMLEDGDRTEKLKAMGKKVIACDLNPLSRTAKMADISIVDNVVRTIPLMIDHVKELSGLADSELSAIAAKFDNKKNLKDMESIIRSSQEPHISQR